MQWDMSIALAFIVALCLLPVAFVWYINLGCILSRVRAREATPKAEAAHEKEAGKAIAVKRFAYIALSLLASVLFPILIWVALFMALREPVLQALRRIAYLALPFFAGILFPVLIWVGLFAAIREPMLRTERRIAYGALFVLVAISMPVLIWVGYAVAIRDLLLWWRGERLPSATTWDEAMPMIKVLVVDDHAMVREGIRAVLALQPDMQDVGDAVNGTEALEKTVELHPDVVLMDIRMPGMNGFEATREICRECPEVKVLMLTQYDEQDNIQASRQVGASGFISKKAVSSLLLTGIRSVNQGKEFIRSSAN